jgi:hypothetical protein
MVSEQSYKRKFGVESNIYGIDYNVVVTGRSILNVKWLSPERNAILFQFLHHFKAHTLSFSANWKTQTPSLSLKKSR